MFGCPVSIAGWLTLCPDQLLYSAYKVKTILVPFRLIEQPWRRRYVLSII